MRVKFRPTIPDDFLDLQGEPPAYRCRGFTAVLDGKILGIGAIVHPPSGGAWASCLITEEGKKFPAAIHRAGLHLVKTCKELGLRKVMATAQPNNLKAEDWLIRLGFHPAEYAGQKVFVWQREDEKCAG